MKTISTILICLFCASALSQSTNRFPLNRAYLQTDLNGAGLKGTNFGTLRATNFVDAATGLPLSTGGSGATNLSPWTTDINAAKHTLTNGQADATFTLPAASISNFYLAIASGQLPLSALTNFSASMTASNYAVAAATFGISNSVIAQFGAVGGDADDTAAFQAAADSGADVFVPAITNGYTVSNIILKNNSHLRGGGSARLKMKSTATGKFVYAQSSAVTNIIFTGFVLDGQGVGATGSGGAPWTFTAGYAVVSSFTTDRSGLYLYNNQTNSFISDLLVKNFSNKGIWIEGALGTFPQPTSHTLSGYDLRLENCYQGILFTNSAEYCSFSDVNCFHCGEAVAIWSGNVSVRGGVMTRNGCGFRVVGSGVTNPAHGSVEDVVLNHNDVAILCTDFNNGFNFNNLIILGGGGEGGGNPIFLTNTCGVNIQNSTLNSGMFASADGGAASANGYNYIDHCKVTGHVPIFQTSSGHLIYNEAVDYGVLTAPKVTNNYAMSFGSAATFLSSLTGNGGGVFTNLANGNWLNLSNGIFTAGPSNTAAYITLDGRDGSVSLAHGAVVINSAGNITSDSGFVGDGSSLTSVKAASITSGIKTTNLVADLRASQTFQLLGPNGGDGYFFKWFSDRLELTNAISLSWIRFNDGIQLGSGGGAGTTVINLNRNTGDVNATTFTGSAANLTSLPAGQLTGTIDGARINTLLTNGYARTTDPNTFSASQAINGANNLNVGGFIISTNGYQAPTNTVAANSALAMGLSYDVVTSGTLTLGISTFSSVPVSTYSYVNLSITSSGTATFTNHPSIHMSDGLTSRVLSNSCEIAVKIIPRFRTNGAIVPFP